MTHYTSMISVVTDIVAGLKELNSIIHVHLNIIDFQLNTNLFFNKFVVDIYKLLFVVNLF